MAQESTRNEILTIAGMSCAHCVRAVREALQSLPSVHVDSVDVGVASVTFDPTCVTRDQLAEAIADAGYQVAGSQLAS